MRVNHRAARRYVIERIKADLPVSRDDLIFLCDQAVRLQAQLDAVQDDRDAEVERLHERMRAEADERNERDGRYPPT